MAKAKVESIFMWMIVTLATSLYIYKFKNTHTHTHKLRGGEGERDVSNVKFSDFKETAFGGMSD